MSKLSPEFQAALMDAHDIAKGGVRVVFCYPPSAVVELSKLAVYLHETLERCRNEKKPVDRMNADELRAEVMRLAIECDRLRSSATREWIPVGERLPETKPQYADGPETSPHVLIATKFGAQEGWREQTNKRREWKWKNRFGDCEPTHWMPLPPPPEADK